MSRTRLEALHQELRDFSEQPAQPRLSQVIRLRQVDLLESVLAEVRSLRADLRPPDQSPTDGQSESMMGADPGPEILSLTPIDLQIRILDRLGELRGWSDQKEYTQHLIDLIRVDLAALMAAIPPPETVPDPRVEIEELRSKILYALEVLPGLSSPTQVSTARQLKLNFKRLLQLERAAGLL